MRLSTSTSPSPPHRRHHDGGGGGRHRRTADVLIVGGGPMGSSTAYHLAAAAAANGSGGGFGGGDDEGGRGRNDNNIVVIERDPTYRRASAVLSAGGIRQQFSLSENVRMSMYGRDFLRDAASMLRTSEDEDEGEGVDVQFDERGYLFLAGTEDARDAMIEANAVQREAGCEDIKLMSRTELDAEFPWLYTDDVLLGSYGVKGEGWFDPWALIRALKNKNIAMGVQYVHGIPVAADRDVSSGNVLSVDVEVTKGGSRSAGTQRITYDVGRVVNACGAHASPLMDLLATPDRPLEYPLPVRPRKRCIFFFHCSASEGVPHVAPLTVDSSLCYFRSEGSSADRSTFLCGASPTPEEDEDCGHDDEAGLDHVDHRLFDDRIWPSLYRRVPAFGEIKVRSGWAGWYDYNTVDQNAIIGFHPEMPNVLMVNGFSGHGLQHSPAAGRAAAELLDYGSFRTLDLGIFGFERFVNGETVFERGIV